MCMCVYMFEERDRASLGFAYGNQGQMQVFPPFGGRARRLLADNYLASTSTL